MNADRDLLTPLRPAQLAAPAIDSEADSLCHDVTCILLECQRDRRGGAALDSLASGAAVTDLARLVARRLAPMISGRYIHARDTRAVRDAAVWTAFSGRNHAEVMRDFKISRRLLYSILARRRRG